MTDDAALREADTEVIFLRSRGPGDAPTEQAFRQPAGSHGPEANWLRNVTAPTLTVVRPRAGAVNGGAVVVAPGGGWRILAWSHEGMDMARWFADRGVTAFVLKYRLMTTPAEPDAFAVLNAAAMNREAELAAVSGKDAPRSLRQLAPQEAIHRARAEAAEDGRLALAAVRERAAEFGVDPGKVGMVGFSAGAFLAADVAMEPGGAPLAWVAPIYGGDTDGRPVPAAAPPLFTCIAGDDRMLLKTVEGLYADWSDADRPAELHIFSHGGHGFGMATQGKPVDRWIGLFDAWLRDLGAL